jgi:hypothetical protein
MTADNDSPGISARHRHLLRGRLGRRALWRRAARLPRRAYTRTVILSLRMIPLWFVKIIHPYGWQSMTVEKDSTALV